jgi:succinylarginine dihydrolase
MPLTEINFDGIVGPSHNYAGLSIGNLASARNARQVSHPRSAALQGLDKMRSNLALGLPQGLFVPPPRPARAWLASLGTSLEEADPVLRAIALSASSMWAANAATVSPAPDTADGRTHLTVANLRTMPHRSHEWPDTLKQLQLAFGAPEFAVHAPVPPAFGDEGAANHMRLVGRHGEPGIEVFVYGLTGGPFPARQHLAASQAIARMHRLDPARTLFVQQSEEAIAAGAFHNDVVAVANENILFAHEQAFADKKPMLAALEAQVPDFAFVEVPAAEVSLADAISSYLFNAQLVTPPDGVPTLIVPGEARENAAVWEWLQRHIAGNGAIRRVSVVDVRESMANGGGPACLRLRVVADPETVDPRFLVDEGKLDRLSAVVEREWPESIASDDLGDPALLARIGAARTALLAELGLHELSG